MGSSKTWQVVVGNVGTVEDTSDRARAHDIYWVYVQYSDAGVGRAAGEPVYLMCDGEIEKEHAA